MDYMDYRQINMIRNSIKSYSKKKKELIEFEEFSAIRLDSMKFM